MTKYFTVFILGIILLWRGNVDALEAIPPVEIKTSGDLLSLDMIKIKLSADALCQAVNEINSIIRMNKRAIQLEVLALPNDQKVKQKDDNIINANMAFYECIAKITNKLKAIPRVYENKVILDTIFTDDIVSQTYATKEALIWLQKEKERENIHIFVWHDPISWKVAYSTPTTINVTLQSGETIKGSVFSFSDYLLCIVIPIPYEIEDLNKLSLKFQLPIFRMHDTFFHELPTVTHGLLQQERMPMILLSKNRMHEGKWQKMLAIDYGVFFTEAELDVIERWRNDSSIEIPSKLVDKQDYPILLEILTGGLTPLSILSSRYDEWRNGMLNCIFLQLANDNDSLFLYWGTSIPDKLQININEVIP